VWGLYKYFSIDYNGGEFKMFSVSHIVAILLLILSIFLIYLFRERLRDKKTNLISSWILSGMLIFQALIYILWSILVGDFSVRYSLPLHLCDISINLCAIMVVNKNKLLFETSYFWGLGGALQAFVTPDLGRYSFPHFLFWQFFSAHGFVILSCMFMVIVERLMPTLKSVWRTFLITNAYMVIIAVVNKLLGSNYLYICEKPQDASIMDYLGPWPWYVLSLEFVAVIIFFICFLPFPVMEYIKKRKSNFINLDNNTLKL
jgi:hypothetical integral membrane protein (TIGR02206 family)